MELFTKLFGNLIAFVYHCFDRIVIHGYLSALSRPEQVVHFFRQVLGVPVVSKEILSQRTADYQNWVERRVELRSKLDELATEELERLLLLSAHRAGGTQP